MILDPYSVYYIGEKDSPRTLPSGSGHTGDGYPLLAKCLSKGAAA